VWIVLSVIRLRDADRGQARPRAGELGQPSRLGTTGEALALAPRLPLVLLGVGLVFLGVLASFTYLPLRITDLGGGPEMVALTAGVSSLAEVPGLLVAGAIAARIGLRGLFGLACLAYAACIASWIVIDQPAVIIATRAVTGFAFGGILVASALTIGSLLRVDSGRGPGALRDGRVQDRRGHREPRRRTHLPSAGPTSASRRSPSPRRSSASPSSRAPARSDRRRWR
jgi:hypothetical protein